MSTKKKIFLGIAICFIAFIAAAIPSWFWLINNLKEDRKISKEYEHKTPADISYLTIDSIKTKGKILAVVTSQSIIEKTGKPTGYELTELSRAYYVFMANGFEVDVASPKGGEAPAVIEKDELGEYDYAFLNDSVAQFKIKNTLSLKDVDADSYDAIYFVGGKGAMFDFPKNETVKRLVRRYYENGKIIGAVCHGPSALLNITLTNGSELLDGKRISSFTNEEELFIIPDAKEVFPFLLQDKLIENGVKFQMTSMYLENVVKDGQLVTGQNPWSTWLLAESMIEALGYLPKQRIKTPEENAVQTLLAYESKGYNEAISLVDKFNSKKIYVQRETIIVHGILALMQFEAVKMINLMRLTAHLN